nr:ADP-ribosylation factor GTPase-activating protein AGD12 [Tanacetum cinerariifolium]
SSNNAPSTSSAKEPVNVPTASSNAVQKPVCVEGDIGNLKITILQGANLAVRDMLSSDPYVVVSLGEQQVFDYDTFSADDIMGEAEIDIQPMLTSAMAYGDASQFGDMQIGISAGKEVDIGLDGGRDKQLRPADMLLYSWDRGLDVCVDLTGSSPLTQTGMVDFVSGRVVIDAAERKR